MNVIRPMLEERMNRHITKILVDVVRIEGKQMKIPFFVPELTYPPRRMNAAAKSNKENPQS